MKTKTLPRWLEIDCDRCGKKFYATRTREKEVKVGAELMCEGCQSYQDGYDEGYAHGLEDGSNKMGFKPRVWTDTEVKKIRKNAKKLAKKLAPNGIDHEEKINWMAIWCAKNGALLNLNGEIGLGRECVGISVNGNYAEYEWHDSELTRIDENGDVWCPEDALRPYVAVLGRGEKAESQLYDWLKWFDDEGFNLETSMSLDDIKNPIQLFIGKRHKVRMVRRK